MYLGLDPKIALGCFDFSIQGKKALSLVKKKPSILLETKEVRKECLISYHDTPCFSVNRYCISKGSMLLGAAPAIYMVTNGSGQILGEIYSRALKKGDFFMLPYHALNQHHIATNTNLELIECLPPLETF